MIFILSKILLFLIKPVVWVLAILVSALLIKNSRNRKLLSWTGAMVLLIFSNSFLVGKVFNAYEANYPKKQQYDIGIVLGGFSDYNKRNQSLTLTSAGDRLFQAIKLYKKGDIKKMLITSGNSNLLDTTVKEADLTSAFLKQLGIPDSAILIENKSRNTVENAKYSFTLIKRNNPKAKILVITSAWHIPRSRLIFDKQAHQKLSYYPTNFIGKTEYDLGDYIIPSALALNNWEIILKEWVGLIVDSIRS